MQSLWPRTSRVGPPPGRRGPRAPTSRLALERQYIVPECLTSGLWAFSSLLPSPLTHVLCHLLSSASKLQLPPSLPDSFTFKMCYVSLLLRCLSRRFQNLYYGYSKAFHNPSPNRLSKNVINMLKWNPIFRFKASSNAMTVSALGFGACPLSPFRLDISRCLSLFYWSWIVAILKTWFKFQLPDSFPGLLRPPGPWNIWNSNHVPHSWGCMSQTDLFWLIVFVFFLHGVVQLRSQTLETAHKGLNHSIAAL